MDKLDLGAFGMLINAMSGGGNAGNLFPQDDAQDLIDGARYIPGEVTDARRQGQTVRFNRTEKKWTMPDGRVIG